MGERARERAAVALGRWTEPGEVYARGRALRSTVDFDDHRATPLAAGRPSVLEFMHASNAGRLAELIPMRVGRMLASPFAFFRGSAGLMAGDLAAGVSTGLTAQLCGDAHAANFGLYGTPDGQIVMDINDFDEALTAYAFAYADQTERDHAELTTLVGNGTLPALIEDR